MTIEVTLIANAGVRVATPGAVFYVDAFHAMGEALSPDAVPPADGRPHFVLVTHAHWDHYDPGLVTDAAIRLNATVIGPRSVAGRLRGRIPAESLCEMEPALAGGSAPAQSVRRDFPGAQVTAYRTFHSRDHNSYLVEADGCRFFHDGDNEDTRRLDAEALGRLDVLLLGPWLGGGWVEFIEKLAPRRYVLIHLDEDELRRHEAGELLPELCDHVPAGLTVLRPGQTLCLNQGEATP
jgi:L-ascorbate metabolism protein UlaG (beta-lactamase superfamily)